MPERIRTRADFNKALADDVPLVIVDVPGKVAQIHLRASRCARVAVETLERTEERDGSWWTVAGVDEALERWGAMLEACPFCTGAARVPALAAAQPGSSAAGNGWIFGVSGQAWHASADAAPSTARGSEFFAAAIPGLDGRAATTMPRPSVVLARVTLPEPVVPGTIHKPLLDALHDGRHAPPYHHELARRPPLPDDGPDEVRGLAVEVAQGDAASTEYLIGDGLEVAGELVGALDVDAGGNAAPSDVRESAAPEHVRFAEAVVRAWQRTPLEVEREISAIVVRHRPIDGRDIDDTWRTWLGALRGTTRAGAAAWRGRAPLAAVDPLAVATLSEPGLGCDVRYELYA